MRVSEKPERPKGLYERLLAEATGSKPWTGYLKSVDSPVLKRLEEKTSSDQPEHMQDLVRLHALIRSGGPDNWASSMWFSFLTGQYPSEYEILKEEHLGKGKSLQEGFRHGRRFSRVELEHLDVNEDLIFCVDQQGFEEYGYFMHEADILLWALGYAVKEGDLTLDELRENWQPYQHLWPTLYETNLRWWEKHLWPRLEGDHDTPVTAAFFMREAENVNIAHVGYLGSYSMSTGDIFEVRGADALATLREAFKGSYRIAVEEDLSNYTSIRPQETMRLFEETLTSED